MTISIKDNNQDNLSSNAVIDPWPLKITPAECNYNNNQT